MIRACQIKMFLKSTSLKGLFVNWWLLCKSLNIKNFFPGINYKSQPQHNSTPAKISKICPNLIWQIGINISSFVGIQNSDGRVSHTEKIGMPLQFLGQFLIRHILLLMLLNWPNNLGQSNSPLRIGPQNITGSQRMSHCHQSPPVPQYVPGSMYCMFGGSWGSYNLHHARIQGDLK